MMTSLIACQTYLSPSSPSCERVTLRKTPFLHSAITQLVFISKDDMVYFVFIQLWDTYASTFTHSSFPPCQLGLKFGIIFLVFFMFFPPRSEINKIWLSELWLSFHYFWMEGKHWSRRNRRGWHEPGTSNSGNNGITIHEWLMANVLKITLRIYADLLRS